MRMQSRTKLATLTAEIEELKRSKAEAVSSLKLEVVQLEKALALKQVIALLFFSILCLYAQFVTQDLF